MRGLELSEKYFFEIGLKMLQNKFPNYLNRIAAGLIGEGSECYGFDDEVSRDHDWGPGFCLWLDKEDYNNIGMILQLEYDRLPKIFEGYGPRLRTELSNRRVGVFEIHSFFAQFTGIEHLPQNLFEWQRIPEEYLSKATNGKIFRDPQGQFTSTRETLMAFYPRDVRLKKMAARCMTAGQSGQYNFLRSLQRKEYVAAHYALSQFINDSISLIFLLNRYYKPFYKWMVKALKNLPILGETLFPLYEKLVVSDMTTLGFSFLRGQVELIRRYIIEELRRQNLSDIQSGFLCDHGTSIQKRIKDPALRGLHVMFG